MLLILKKISAHISGSFLNRDLKKDLKLTPKAEKYVQQETPKRNKLMIGSPLRSKMKIDLADMDEKVCFKDFKFIPKVLFCIFIT